MAVDSTLLSTLISSWGGKYDTTYVLIDEADEIIKSKFNYEAWDDLDDDQKTALLISASRSIDGACSWIGSRYFSFQTLEFPRNPAGGGTISGEANDSYWTLSIVEEYQVEMKRKVKIATVEQAFWIMRLQGVDTHAENQMRGIASVSENYGNVSESVSYKGGASIGQKLCPEAKALLRKYVSRPKLVRG